MKNIVFALCILFSINVYAQENNNFIIIDGSQLIW